VSGRSSLISAVPLGMSGKTREANILSQMVICNGADVEAENDTSDTIHYT